MKPHHAAALALVAWYFIYAPRVDGLKVPFSEWHRGNSEPLESREACERFRQGELKLSQDDPKLNPAQKVKVETGLKAGLCLKDGDPRLKGIKPPPWHFDARGNFIVEPTSKGK